MGPCTVLILCSEPERKLSKNEVIILVAVFYGGPATIIGAAIGAICVCARRIISKRRLPVRRVVSDPAETTDRRSHQHCRRPPTAN